MCKKAVTRTLCFVRRFISIARLMKQYGKQKKLERLVFYIATPCSLICGYQGFGRVYWIHLQGTCEIKVSCYVYVDKLLERRCRRRCFSCSPPSMRNIHSTVYKPNASSSCSLPPWLFRWRIPQDVGTHLQEFTVS